MADNFSLRVDIEYMQKQQTAMCKMWSSRPSNTVKTRWWPRKRVLFGWCQTIIFPLLHCATHLLFSWQSVLIALVTLVLRSFFFCMERSDVCPTDASLIALVTVETCY